MIRTIFCILIATLVPLAAFADAVVAARTIRAKSVLTAADLMVHLSTDVGAIQRKSDIIGLEAKVVLYQGRPISLSDVGPPAVIERNQPVTIVFARGLINISADGRAMARAAAGDQVKVMNMESRKIVSGTVTGDGRILVGAHIASQ